MTVLMHFRQFPVAMGRWFQWGFEQLGHKVITAGPYSNTIPWPGNPSYPQYDWKPDIELEDRPYTVREVLEMANEPVDFVFQASDTHWLTGSSPIPNYILGTDPHVLDYRPRLDFADHFFCMQNCYMKEYDFPRKTWVPYAIEPKWHYPKDNLWGKDYDVVCIGQQYEERHKALEAMRQAGLRVYENIGDIYHEGTDRYARGIVAFNLSSKEDLTARFWEGMAYGRVVVTNVLPDLRDVAERFGILEGTHYLAYNTIPEAVEQVKWVLNNFSEARKIAYQGMKAVEGNTYAARCKQILEVHDAIVGN